MQAIQITIGAPAAEAHSDLGAHNSTVNYANGDQYVGDFVNGHREGEGAYTFQNGDVYEGAFEAGQFHGKGKFTTYLGDCYEGYITHGRVTGFGKITFQSREDVTEYTGQWLEGRASGKGDLKFASKDKFSGLFENGVFHGKGVLSYSNGDAYDGDYANGNPTGQGKMLFAQSKVIMNRNLRDGVDRASTAELKSNTFSLEKKKKNDLTVLQGQNRPKAGGSNPNANVMNSILGNLGSVGGKGGKQLAKPKAGQSKSNTREELQEHHEEGVSRSRRQTTQAKKGVAASRSQEKGVKKAITKQKSSKKVAATKVSKVKSQKSKAVAKVKKLNKSKIAKPLKTANKQPAAKSNPRIVVKIKKARKPRTSNKPDMHYAARQRTNVCGTTKSRREGINLEEVFGTDAKTVASVKRSKSMLKTIALAEEYLRYKYGKDDDESQDDGQMQEDKK